MADGLMLSSRPLLSRTCDSLVGFPRILVCVRSFAHWLELLPAHRYGGMTNLPHSPIGAIRVLQLPFDPKYCWVTKAQSLMVGSTETDEKSPNRTVLDEAPDALPPVA
jgi:hypothetical protein